MRAVFRLYVNTSKGGDAFLGRELSSLGVRARYDQHLHAFYMDAGLGTLFDLSFRSLTAENMWVQIGKPFPAVDERTFQQHLENLQFKNYLPIRRGLVENITLSILTRETQYPLSDRVITAFLQDALQREITKREYHQAIVKEGGAAPHARLPYHELREIVHRKWEQEDMLRETHFLQQLTHARQNQPQLLSSSAIQLTATAGNAMSLQQGEAGELVEQAMARELASELPYHPHLTFYVRRNQGRLLLKLNKQEMYKHGWKKQVGWAPIRETLAAAVLTHSQLLQQPHPVKLWDPFCGSATIPIVAAAQYHSLRVRSDPQENFVWPHWSIYKPQYLEEYLRSQEASSEKAGLQLVCSDISFQATNYAINNLRALEKAMPEPSRPGSQSAVTRVKPTDQICELRGGEWGVVCGDFESVAANVVSGEGRVSIVTNLPYSHSRSREHIPLSQLASIYRRFNRMLQRHAARIANVFLILNAPTDRPHHFLTHSSQHWQQVAAFQSGGMPIALYAWGNNEIKPEFLDMEAVKHEIMARKREIEALAESGEVAGELAKYRARVREIEKKNYFLPRHLLKFKRGWRRVVEKRRRRHLLHAYDLFARRRDKLIAFAEYSKKKLEVGMLRRGHIWRKRNMRLLQGTVDSLEPELKREFETRIQQALAKSEEDEKYRQEKRKQLEEHRQKQREAYHKMHEQRHLARNPELRGKSPGAAGGRGVQKKKAGQGSGRKGR